MKSKFFAVATFAFAMAFAVSAGAVYQTDIYTAQSGYLSVGSGYGAKAYQNANVKAAQTALNACMPGMSLSIDGKFGPLTADKFGSFQASKGIKVDRVIGPVTAGQLAACSGNVTPTTPGSTTLSGGAGDAAFTTTSTDVETSLKEGESNVNVLGFQVEADGSDINVSNVKLVLSNSDFVSSSEKLSDYVDTVSVFMGDKEVGSADASDFVKDSGSPDTYTKTISLSNAVVKDTKKVKFYVAFTAIDNIDSTDVATASWDIDLDTVRYNDATGAILSDTSLSEDFGTTGNSTVEGVEFTEASTDDDLSIKSSSANPLASTLMVEEDNTSDSYLVGAYKLDVDSNSSDITLNEFPVHLEIASNSVDNGGYTSVDSIIDSVTVKIGSDSFDAELSNDDATTYTDFDGATGTATYTVTVDGDVTIDAGDDAEVKIYVTFKDQGGVGSENYTAGTTVTTSTTADEIDAEGSDNVAAGNLNGSFSGKTHTLSVNAPTFALVSKSLALYQAVDGVTTGEEDVFLAKFVFNVTAGDEDVYLSRGVEGDAGYTDYVSFTQLGGGAIDSQTLEAEDESIDDGLTSSFLISSGDTEKFTLSFFVRGNNESEKFTINGFSYGAADDTASAYVYASDVTSGLSSFATTTVYLAK